MTLRRTTALCAWAAAAALMAGCQSTNAPALYVKSPTLGETWKGAGPALAEAEYLKVFDEQLKALDARADEQDLAVARNGVARRDEAVTRALAARRAPGDWVEGRPWPKGSAEADLGAILNAEFGLLLGGAPDAGQLNRLFSLEDVTLSRMRRLAVYEDLAVDERAQFERLRPRPKAMPPAVARSGEAKGRRPDAKDAPPIDTSCPRLDAMTAAEKATLASSAGAGKAPLEQLFKTCAQVAAIQKQMDADLGRIGVRGGELQAALDQAKAARKALTPTGVQDLVDDLKTQMKAAEASGKRRQDELASLRANVREALLKAKDQPVTQELALQHLGELIDGYLRADICSAGKAVEAELTAAAKCGETPDGRGQASWRFLESLALVADATDPDTRSAPWLAGAKAIVAAAEADVKLQTELAKAVSRLRQERARALLIRASGLAKAELALRGKVPGCADRLACAVVFFGDSQDRGRTPSEILAWREVYLEREYAVRRERAAADRERQLLQAAATQMQAYVDGGVDPTLIARAAMGLGLVVATVP